MVTQREGPFRPYAPPANIISVLQRLRRMNMPSHIGRNFLRGAGISDNIIPRVIAALRFLDLMSEEDEPTELLHTLAASSEEDYPGILDQIIRTAYAEDFENINPSTDLQTRIIGAFQRYQPRSQHSRQVMLLLGLCREAGMTTADAPRERGMQQRRPRSHSANEKRQGRQPRQPTPERRRSPEGGGGGQREVEQFLGITLEDAARMPKDDFKGVWAALGTVFRHRALRAYPIENLVGEGEDPEEEEPETTLESR